MEVPTRHGMLASRLFDQHGPAIHRYLRRLTGDSAAADDLAQEVFLRVVRAAHTYDPSDRERAWLFRIARNVFLDLRRRDARAPFVRASVEAVVSPSQSVRTGVREALASLSDDDRDAFLLGEVGGLTYAEIASATGSTVPAVRSRIYRARLALCAALAPPAPMAPGAFPRHEDDD